MDKRSRIILFFLGCLGVLSIFFSCERDDICADVNVTPRVIIRFVEFTDTDSFNDVVDLQIQYIPDEGEMVVDNLEFNVFDQVITSDSIVLPLPTFKDSARYRFIQNFALNVNDEGEEIEDLSDAEIDIVEFTYTRTDEYVNRACGFKTVYSDLKVTNMAGDGATIAQGFIMGIGVVINEIIENEDEAHVRFSH